MKRLVREWIEKASADLRTAEREYRARNFPNYDAVCFHAQQCIEKLLKARLQAADVKFAKTHSLVSLLEQIIPIEPFWEIERPDLHRVTAYAVSVRYPGECADKEQALEALKVARHFREKLSFGQKDDRKKKRGMQTRKSSRKCS